MKEYVIRYRKGKPVKVHKQIILWRKRRQEAAKLKAELEAKLLEAKKELANAEGVETRRAVLGKNLFSDE